MAISANDLEKRLAELKRKVPSRGFERHASFIKSLEELPPELQTPAVSPVHPHFETMIVFPPQIQRGRHYVPRQALLFTPAEVTHLLASVWPGEPPQVTRIEAHDLFYLKVSLLLLYGSLEIVGRGTDAPIRLAMEFNTVAWDKLAPPIRRLLQESRPPGASPLGGSVYSPEAEAAIQRLPVKFSNGISIHGLLPGEQLEDLVFQPGVKERLLLLFNHAVLANTLVLLTDHFVVVIEEELKVAQGWIVSYIPRQNITGIHCCASARWNELTFQLTSGGQSAEYRLRLNDEAAQCWKSVWSARGGSWQNMADAEQGQG